MAKTVAFPDVNDRTPNEPCVLLSSAQVLRIYNQAQPINKEVRVTDTVKVFLKEESVRLKWNTAEFIGQSLLLKAEFV